MAWRKPADDQMQRLAIERLTLSEFRCYRAARLRVDARPVVLTGPNGAGKTNLLEALSFLVPGRGLRRARLTEVARRDGVGRETEPRPWAVAASVLTVDGSVEIGTGRGPDGDDERRAIRIDGHNARSQSALAKHVSAVWLTPQMDRLFLEGTSGRRRFLDRLVFGFDPSHAGRITAYDNALRQRARVLRDGVADAAWLDALEDAIATRGVAIAAARRELVDRLNRVCAESISTFPRPGLAVAGVIEDWLVDTPALAVEERFRVRLADARSGDAGHGGTALGTHRSDLRVADRARDMPAEQCSTGEQKALLIAIVLANARLQAETRGAAPLLLLDEIAAHLDADRRRALFDEVCGLGAQAWMTGTEEELFAPLDGRAQFFRVHDATLTTM
jgi:DNA replication and repair protein RecF